MTTTTLPLTRRLSPFLRHVHRLVMSVCFKCRRRCRRVTVTGVASESITTISCQAQRSAAPAGGFSPQRTYLKKPSKLSWPFCALNLFGSYCCMSSFARAGLAQGQRISLRRGSRCVLLRNSTSWAMDMHLRLELPTLGRQEIVTLLSIRRKTQKLLTCYRIDAPPRSAASDICTNCKSPRIEISILICYRPCRMANRSRPVPSRHVSDPLYFAQKV